MSRKPDYNARVRARRRIKRLIGNAGIEASVRFSSHGECYVFFSMPYLFGETTSNHAYAEANTLVEKLRAALPNDSRLISRAAIGSGKGPLYDTVSATFSIPLWRKAVQMNIEIDPE